MPADLSLFLNQSAKDPANALVQSFFSAFPAELPVWMRGSQKTVALHFLLENPDPSDASKPFIYDDPSSWDGVKMALGEIDDPPDGTTFSLTDLQSGQDSSAMAYNAVAATLQTAIRTSLSTNYSAAVVTGNAPSFEIDRVTLGAIDDMTGDGALLFPAGSSVLVEPTQTGDATHSQRWKVTLLQASAAMRSTGWSPLPPAAVSVETQVIGTSDRNKTFRIVWNADAYAGSVFLNFMGVALSETIGPIRYNATEEEIQTLFQDHTEAVADWVVVVKNSPGDYSLTCVGEPIRRTDAPSLGEDSNTLAVPVGLTATFDCNRAGLDYLLGTANEITDATFEIEPTKSGVPSTVLQVNNAIVRKDMIRNTSIASSPILPATLSNHPGVTGLTGGGVTKLDGIVTADTLSAGHLAIVNVPGSPTFWRLTAGTTAEDAPGGVVRPDDYHASTNAKVWLSVL